MTKVKRRGGAKPSPGDVFALRLEDKPGLVCFQFVHRDPRMGTLIRVFPLVRSESVSVADLADSAEQFFTYVALDAMVREGLATLLGTAPIVAVPSLRAAGGIEKTGKPVNWWIFPPEGQEYRVDNLSAEQERLSLRQFITADALYFLVATGWTPATAEEHRLRAAARQQHGDSQLSVPDDGRANVVHYSYYKSREAAERAAAEFRQRSYEVSVSRSADPASGWLMKVDTGTDTGASDQIEQLTVTLNGEYDGWETRIANGSTSSNED